MQPRSCPVALERDEGAAGLGQVLRSAGTGASSRAGDRVRDRAARDLDQRALLRVSEHR